MMLAHTPAFLAPGGAASGSCCGSHVSSPAATAIRGAALASSDDGELHDPSYAESLRALHARIGQASSSSSSSAAAAAGSSSSRAGTPRRRSALLAHPSPRSSPRLGGGASLPTTPRLGAAAGTDSSSDSDSDASDAAAADMLQRRRLSASSSAHHDDDHSRPPSLSTRRASSRRASYATADLGCTTSGSASPFTPGTPLLLSVNCRRPTSRDSNSSRTGRSLLSLDAPASPTLASSGSCARRGSRKAPLETPALDNWAGGFTGIVDVERRRAASTHSEEQAAPAEAQPASRAEERKHTRRAFSATPLGHRTRSAPRSRRAESAPPPHDGLAVPAAPHMAPSSSDSGSSSHSGVSSRPALPTPSRLSSNGRPMLSTIISSGAPERLYRSARSPLDATPDSDSKIPAAESAATHDAEKHASSDADSRTNALRRCVQSAWLGVRFKALNAKRRLAKHDADEKAW